MSTRYFACSISSWVIRCSYLLYCLVIYKWVHMRKEGNKPIPTTMNEMRDMMSRDHSGITVKDMMKLNPQQSKYKNNRAKVRM